VKITLGMLYGRQYAYEAGKESPQRFEITITIVFVLFYSPKNYIIQNMN